MTPAAIFEILAGIGSAQPCLPPTLLYNEGWLLRLVLDAASRGVPGLPFRFEPGARWFSEALLYSAFLPRRRGDPLAESCTHADGVIGHFVFNPQSKAGLALCPGGTQFVVCEAKLFSPLSQGTKRAPGFDQAARNVACMAETLRRAGKPAAAWNSLGFFLVAPRSQIGAGIFAEAMDRNSIRRKIADRIAAYEPEFRSRLEAWRSEWVGPLLETIDLRTLAWEDLIEPCGAEIMRFYELCLRFNST